MARSHASGEGESLLKGIYALRQHARFSWVNGQGVRVRKVVWNGASVGHRLGSGMIGIDVYGVEGFYIPFFYALSDQFGANVASDIFLRKHPGPGEEP